MTRKEFEKFKELYALATTKLKNKDKELWAYFFGKKGISFGSNAMLVEDYIEKLASYNSYDDVPKFFTEYEGVYENASSMVQDSFFANDFSRILKDMEVVVKTVDQDMNGNEYDHHEETPLDLDKSFFSRKVTELKNARGRAIFFNSPQFDELEEALQEVVQELSDLDAFSERRYLNKLDSLQEKIDAYLVHKVKDGTNERASGKINAAMSMKKFITERKAEVFRAKMTSSDNSKKQHLMDDDSADEKNEVYQTKLAEVTTLMDVVSDVNRDEFGGKNQQDVFTVTVKAKEFLDQCYNEEDYFKSLQRENADMLRDKVAAFITAELVRNEIATSGGKATPLLDKFYKDPKGFAATIKETPLCYLLTESKEDFEKYIMRDSKSNAILIFNNGLGDAFGDIVNVSVSNNIQTMKAEAKIIAQKMGAQLPETKNVEPNELAKAYANLALYELANRVTDNPNKTSQKYDEQAKALIKNEMPEFNEMKDANEIKEQVEFALAQAKNNKAKEVNNNTLGENKTFKAILSIQYAKFEKAKDMVKEDLKRSGKLTKDVLAKYISERLISGRVEKMSDKKYSQDFITEARNLVNAKRDKQIENLQNTVDFEKMIKRFPMSAYDESVMDNLHQAFHDEFKSVKKMEQAKKMQPKEHEKNANVVSM